jgi:hypothetical protein
VDGDVAMGQWKGKKRDRKKTMEWETADGLVIVVSVLRVCGGWRLAVGGWRVAGGSDEWRVASERRCVNDSDSEEGMIELGWIC